MNVNSSRPADGPDADFLPNDSWQVDMNNGSTSLFTFRVWAICTSATATSVG